MGNLFKGSRRLSCTAPITLSYALKCDLTQRDSGRTFRHVQPSGQRLGQPTLSSRVLGRASFNFSAGEVPPETAPLGAK